MTTNTISIDTPDQLVFNDIGRKRKKRKLSQFLKYLSVTPSVSMVSNKTKELQQNPIHKPNCQNILSYVTSSEESILSVSSKVILTELGCQIPVDTQAPQVVQLSLRKNQTSPKIHRKSHVENPIPTSLLIASKAEIESKTRKNTELNSEYLSKVQLVLKPIFLNQPRPSSPVIGPSTFITETSNPNPLKEEESSSCHSTIKWRKDLISFESSSKSIPFKPALKKPIFQNVPSSKNNTFNKENSIERTVTVQEFVYVNDSPIAINTLLSPSTTSKYSSVSIDEFLSNISDSTTFKFSASARRRLQVSRK